MRNKRRTDEEWLSLIQQCRSSGFSDRVWCEHNDISINTFYNTVTRLRFRLHHIRAQHKQRSSLSPFPYGCLHTGS